MATNKLIKYNLENRAVDLKGEGKSFEEIASVLSKESKNKITSSSVFRFFESHEIAVAQAISKNDKLQAKVADIEINTVNKRYDLIDKLIDLSERAASAGEFQAAQAALRGANDVYKGLDDRIFKLNPPKQTTEVNIVTIQEQVNAARADVSSRVDSITVRLRERGILQQSD
ncbi:MAG: hypothetical protein ABFD07_17940 [Methanobacterium sp.]